MLLNLDEQALKKKLEASLPNSEATFEDLTGTRDHWSVTVVSDSFEGKSLIQQHRLVKDVFDKEIQAGHLHALTIKTYTRSQYKKIVGG